MEITPLETKEIKEAPSAPVDPVIDEMTKAGLYFGHQTSKTHPKMKPYIAGVRNGIHILNLEKTKETLGKALQYIEDLTKNGKVLLLVGTKVQVKELVKTTALHCGLPYISERWIGGTFTNFETIQKRITQMIDLGQKKEAGELEKYTKKEQLKIGEEMKELEKKYGGLRTLTKLPDAIFICDPDKNLLSVKEANRRGIPTIGICDTNIDPALLDYSIFANDDATSSVQYILQRIEQTILSSKQA